MNRLTFLIALSPLLSACSTTGEITAYQRTDAVRIAFIRWNKPADIEFQFADNVALFERLDPARSYLLRNQTEKIPIEARSRKNADGTEQGVTLNISRQDRRNFESGHYDFHIVLHSAYPDHANHKASDVQRGGFDLEVRPSISPGRPQTTDVYGTAPDTKEEAEQVETQQPPLAALSATSPVI